MPNTDACLCLPHYMLQDPNARHYWWARATSPGPAELRIVPVAMAVSSAEAGGVNIDVYGPTTPAIAGALVGSSSVAHPNVTGQQADGPAVVIASPAAGSLYRIEVSLLMPPPGTPIARHYSLTIHGASLLGAHSPLPAQAEAVDARWGINVALGETVEAIVLPGPEAGATSATVRVYNPFGALRATVGLGVPILITTSVSAGMWLVNVSGANGHYTVSKLGPGLDRGVYVGWFSSGYGALDGAITIGGSPSTIPVTVNVFDQLTGALVATFTDVTSSFYADKLAAGFYTVELIVPPGLTAPRSQRPAVVCDGETRVLFDIPNIPPVALAGPDQILVEGSTAFLDGSASFDPDGTIVSYAWDVVARTGPPIVLSAPGSAMTSFFGADDASYTLRLTVRDNFGTPTSDHVGITFVNAEPTANAGPDVAEFWGLPILFAGSGADVGPNDTAAGLVTNWSFGDDGNAPGPHATHAYATPGTYTATFTVSDDDGGVGSDTAQASISRRPSSLSYTGPSTVGLNASVPLSAHFNDPINIDTAILAGHAVRFEINGTTFYATTDAQGDATVLGPILPPGTYQVLAAFDGDTHYFASQALGTVSVAGATDRGHVTGGEFRQANGGRGGLNVHADGSTVRGELQFQDASGLRYHAHTMLSLDISPDCREARFTGIDDLGRAFTAFLLDAGEPGRDDVLRLSIGGVPVNGDGAVLRGNLQIHCPHGAA